jgi:hypothetical protein
VNNSASPRGERPRAFLGVRHPGLRFALAVLVVIAIGAGAYLTYDRYVLQPRRHEDIASGAEAAKRHARWQRSGRRGWERLFEEATRGLPGYAVDTGQPARLKLAELGPQIAPFVEEKLQSDVYAERMTAIYLLAAIGTPTDRIVSLLDSELERATDGHREIGALKCAARVPESGTVLWRVSLAALESPRAKTRRTAVAYLFKLRDAEGAPPAIGERLAELAAQAHLKVRLEIAVHTIGEDAAGSYRTLLEGLDSDDAQAVIVAADLVAQLRGEGSMDPATATPQQKAEAIEADRAWLEQKISEAQSRQPAAEGPGKTSSGAGAAGSEDTPAEETPQQTEPEED